MKDDHDITPVLAGLALVGMGIALRRTEPGPLHLPEPKNRARFRDVRDSRSAAKAVRDGIAGTLPRNMTGSLGRTFIIMGASLLAVRLLDALVDDEGVDY